MKTETETQTRFEKKIARACEAFGADFVNGFLFTRDRDAYVRFHFESRPVASCILYAIGQAIENANDDHGKAVWSKAWDDCFADTFEMWLDDWSMIEHSGICNLNHNIWSDIGGAIQSYLCGFSVTEKTLAEIILHFWDVELILAKDDFQLNPHCASRKESLLEILGEREKAYRIWVIKTHSMAKDANLENGGF